MNTSPLPKVLLAVLAVVAVLSLWYCWAFIKNIREVRQLQAQMGVANYQQQVFGMFLNEVNEYSKKNPAVEPVLRSLTGTPTNTSAGAASPKTTSK